MALRFCLALAVILGLMPKVAAQGPGQMVVHSYGGAQGLPEIHVNAMIQDQQGRYWVAGDRGVYLGDGTSFLRTFPASDGDNPFISALAEDSQGGIYAAGENGLWYLRGTQWEPAGQGLPSRAFGEPLGLYIDGARTIWLQWGKHLFQLKGPGQFASVNLPAEGLAYVCPRLRTEGLLIRIGPRGWSWEHGAWHELPDLPLRRGEECKAPIQEDHAGTLWAGTYLRVFRLNPLTRKWEQQPDPDGNNGFAGGTSSPGGISSPNPGEIWAMGDQVARRLDQVEPTLETGPTFSTFSLKLLLRDREGHLWADRDGLRRLGGPWRIHSGGEGLPIAGIWQPLRDLQGQLWVSTTKGLFRARGHHWELIWGAGIHAQIALGADGHVWAVERLSGRILRFDARGKLAPIPSALRAVEGIRGISGTSTTLAFATRGGRIYFGHWQGSDWAWQSITSPVRPETLRTFADARGRIHFVGKNADRQVVYSMQGGPWSPLPLETNRDITDIKSTADDTLLATEFIPPTLHVFKLREGRWVSESKADLEHFSPCKTAYGVGMLEDGRTWVLTDHGVLELDPKHPERGRHFTSQDGLPLDDCNQFGLLIEKDRLWVSTGTGLASYERQAEHPLPDLPAPFLLGTRVGEQPWTLALPESLPPGTRSFSLQIGLSTPSRHAHLRFQWQDLERSSEWHEFEAPTLTFLDPGAGSHRIRIRALEPGDHASPVWACTFQVLRPWWQRTWALLIWILAGAGGALLLHQLRLRRIQQRNAELAALVEERTSALADSEARERQASKAKSAFLADMSHELRTPLNAILLYSELIHQDAEEQGSAELEQDSGRILSAGRHLLSLINGILDLSKVEAGKMTLALETIDLKVLLEEVVTTLSPLAKERENELVIEAPESGLSFETDALKLKQVMINLVSNAIKFTSAGRVTLRANVHGDQVRLEVADTGVGMTPEQASRLFLAYEQPTQESGYKAGGTGLGLTISRKYVELLGGTIDVHSEQGQGTTFLIWLPMTPPSAREAPH
jgi:signal transduction histidine kinase